MPDDPWWWEGLWFTTLQMTAFRAPVPNWHLPPLCFPEGDLGSGVWSFFPRGQRAAAHSVAVTQIILKGPS